MGQHLEGNRSQRWIVTTLVLGLAVILFAPGERRRQGAEGGAAVTQAASTSRADPGAMGGQAVNDDWMPSGTG